MSEMSSEKQIMPMGPRGISKQGSSLVRRGLEQLLESPKEKGRVLLVDDEEAILDVAESLLAPAGYEVRCTSKSLEAIALARSFQPHVAFLGVYMPFIGGLQLGREFSKFLPATKIVLWIESVDAEDVEAFRRDGYDFALFPAPFEREELLKKVDSWVRDATQARPIGDGLRAHEREWVVPFDVKEPVDELHLALLLSERGNREPQDEDHNSYFMVDRFAGLKVEVFSNEHPPPHFRVKAAGETANYDISDCVQLNGGLRKYYRAVRDWHAIHKQTLIDEWDKRRPTDCPVGKYRHGSTS